jgi:myo-inositol-1(or 4)-monophosphatase
MLALSAKHDWDLAAAQIILTEAGGIVTTHKGDSILYNGKDPIQPSVIGAGPMLHKAILSRVAHLNLSRGRQ